MWNRTQKFDENGNLGNSRELYFLDGWKLRADENGNFYIQKNNDIRFRGY